MSGPGRQDGDAGVGVVGEALQRVAEGAEEAGQAVDVRLGVEVGEDARGGDAVLQREAGAGGRLGAVAEHPPGAVGAAADLEGEEVQVVAAARRRRRPAGAATRGCRRSGAPAGGRRRPGGSGRRGRRATRLEQVGALDRGRAAMRAPLRLLDQDRDVGERPGALGRAGGAVLAEEDAGVAQVLVAAGEAAGEVLGREAGEVVDELPPDRADAAVRVEQLVGDAGRRAVGGEQARRPDRRRRCSRASMLRSRAPGAGRGSSGTRGAASPAAGM